jgi:hypothetical protein
MKIFLLFILGLGLSFASTRGVLAEYISAEDLFGGRTAEVKLQVGNTVYEWERTQLLPGIDMRTVDIIKVELDDVCEGNFCSNVKPGEYSASAWLTFTRKMKLEGTSYEVVTPQCDLFGHKWPVYIKFKPQQDDSHGITVLEVKWNKEPAYGNPEDYVCPVAHPEK